MTFAEILWLVHMEQIDYLREHEPRKMRGYLIETGDDEMLISWDKEQMSPKKTPGTSRSPGPRRRR